MVSVDDEVAKKAIQAAAASRKTWYEWIGDVARVMRPLSIIAVISLVLNVLQWHQNMSLESEAQKQHPIMVLVDPTKTQVLRTITLDDHMYTPDQAAEEDFIKRWVKGFFGVTNDALTNRDTKNWVRSHIIDQTAALTKVDAYFAEHDPVVLGETEHVDVVHISVTPEIGSHRYRFTATLQPYQGPSALPAHDISGDVGLEVLLPQNAPSATTEYPYVYVKELTWGTV